MKASRVPSLLFLVPLCLFACRSAEKESVTSAASPGRQAAFDLRHELEVNVPQGAKRLRIWFALPQDEAAEEVTGLKVEAPLGHRTEKDSQGNKVLYLEADSPAPGKVKVVETFGLTRKEQRTALDPARTRPLAESERVHMAAYLGPNQHVELNDEVRRLSSEIAGGEKNPVLVARKFYDWEVTHIDYWVKDPKNRKASPVGGSTTYCMQTKTGNCSDFNSLWASLARAADIPTRIVYGSFLKKDLDGQDVDQSYHCWVEFYAPGYGWVPHDAPVANIFTGAFPLNADNEKLVRLATADGYKGPEPAKVEYYFGNIEERRVTWSRGRDIVLNPRQEGAPLNAFTKAYVEVDGKPLVEKEGWTRKLTYRERK